MGDNQDFWLLYRRDQSIYQHYSYLSTSQKLTRVGEHMPSESIKWAPIHNPHHSLATAWHAGLLTKD